MYYIIKKTPNYTYNYAKAENREHALYWLEDIKREAVKIGCEVFFSRFNNEWLLAADDAVFYLWRK